ncbi:MAG: hypothetical protein ABFS38_14475 [Bacteroidota bacterium]
MTIFRRLLILLTALFFSSLVHAQVKRSAFEIFLLNDINLPYYSAGNSSCGAIEKHIETGLGITYGMGTQTTYNLHRNFLLQFGLGLKYTSWDLWFSSIHSSFSDCSSIAMEQTKLIHLTGPLSIYYQSAKIKRFRVRPGIGLEPNLLVYSHNSLTPVHEDLLAEIAGPESTPSRLPGTISVNLKVSYDFARTNGIFMEMKIHNATKYFKEEFSELNIPIGIMINLGYKFKTRLAGRYIPCPCDNK